MLARFPCSEVLFWPQQPILCPLLSSSRCSPARARSRGCSGLPLTARARFGYCRNWNCLYTPMSTQSFCLSVLSSQNKLTMDTWSQVLSLTLFKSKWYVCVLSLFKAIGNKKTKRLKTKRLKLHNVEHEKPTACRLRSNYYFFSLNWKRENSTLQLISACLQ